MILYKRLGKCISSVECMINRTVISLGPTENITGSFDRMKNYRVLFGKMEHRCLRFEMRFEM